MVVIVQYPEALTDIYEIGRHLIGYTNLGEYPTDRDPAGLGAPYRAAVSNSAQS